MVLPQLQQAIGKADLIYIDPPYNTGNDFAYHDKFRSEWAAMMRPRLVAGAELLAEHGAIFVSIDDGEVAQMRILLDEVFGASNFIAQIVVNLNPKGRQLGRFFATSHEYVLVYAKSLPHTVLDASSTAGVNARDFPKTAPDGRRYRELPLRNTNKKFNPRTARTLHYPLWGDPETGGVRTAEFPGGQRIMPVFGDGTDAVWRWSAPLVEERTTDLTCRLVRGQQGVRADIFQLDWLHADRRKKLASLWLAEEVGSTDSAVAELKSLLGPVFESPKPTGLLTRIVDTFPEDAVVVDFFAGSGTTGHAVALLNEADGGSRRCYSINSAEPTRQGSNAQRAGYATVAEVTRARLQAVDTRLGCGYAELSL